MVKKKTLRYDDFVDQIDLDALYEALDWEPLFQRGPEDVGYCLFPDNHKNGDTTGKFAFNREKHVTNCWVCGGATLPELISRLKHISKEDAIDWLYQFSRPQEKSNQQFYAEIEKILDNKPVKDPPFPYFKKAALDEFEECPSSWLDERHINRQVANYFELRFTPNHKREPRQGGPAIILPHFWNKQLVGWQERWLDGLKPKYTNTLNFPRERSIWGLDFCARQEELPILVESVPTALYLISEGYPAMATFGSQVTQKQIGLLRAFHKGLILAPDNDVPGNMWVERLNSLLVYLPLFILPPVHGHGNDLGDLNPIELKAHLNAVSLHTPFI